MRKLFFTLVMLLACMAAEAKVIKITLIDGKVKVFTSSQLSAIDFNDDGTLLITTHDGKQLPALEADFDEVDIDEDAAICEIYPDTLSFNIDADGIPVDLHTTRPIMKVNYVYPSVDPWGEPIMLSGTILVPIEIWLGETSSEGILMVNHYTKFHRDEAPTRSNGELENMLLANPLKPNYIIVESDFYGFGVTERFPQAFLQGLVNARASLDGLLAARDLLDEMGFEYGPLCFNIGYSSGGFDALAAQKLRDMEYADRISFDKTFSGGGPSNVCEAYRQYVQIDSTAYNAVPLLLMVCTNEIQNLGLDYNDVFQPYISSSIDELILSKSYSSWPVCDRIGREKKVHEILSPTYCDLNSEESLFIQRLLTSFSLTTDDGWVPDTTQRIYLFHSRGDDYVPIKSARPMISFLKKRGFTPSLIPGKTNFQTNFVVRKMGHLSATLVYLIQTVAAIKAWPMMYTANQLNPTYKELVSKEFDVVGTMRQLDAMGFDCRGFILKLIEKLSSQSSEGESGELNPVQVASTAMALLNQFGLTMDEVVEMSEDSGFDLIGFMMELITYFAEQPAQPGTDESENADEANETKEEVAARRLGVPTKMVTPRDVYELQLTDWLKDNGLDM